MSRPRVRNTEEKFESRPLPLFTRRTNEVSELFPQLYLRGLSEGDFHLALRGLLGDDAPVSSAIVARLKDRWNIELSEWRGRRLDELEVVYICPREHWQHLRPANLVESPFASLRLRTDAAKRYKRVHRATAVIWKMLRVVEQRFMRLRAPELMKAVYNGEKYEDGVVRQTVEEVVA